MAQTPVRTGAAVLAVLVAAFIGTVIVIAEAIVRLLGYLNEARPNRKSGR